MKKCRADISIEIWSSLKKIWKDKVLFERERERERERESKKKTITKTNKMIKSNKTFCCFVSIYHLISYLISISSYLKNDNITICDNLTTLLPIKVLQFVLSVATERHAIVCRHIESHFSYDVLLYRCVLRKTKYY